MFNSEELQKEPVEVFEKKKEPSDFSIDDLMRTHITALFTKAKINDDFHKSLYLVLWEKMLVKEIARLRSAVFSDETLRVVRVQSIEDKIKQIKEMKSYNRIGFTIPKTQAETTDSDDAVIQLSKLDKQKEAILKAIWSKKFEPMKIPDGKKRTIKLLCEKENPYLFDRDTSFDRAWKSGTGHLWKMEHHDSYARRGNN